MPGGVGDRLARDPGHVLASSRRQVGVEVRVNRDRDVEAVPQLVSDRVERFVGGCPSGSESSLIVFREIASARLAAITTGCSSPISCAMRGP